jgi:hypothetical protein
LVLGAATKNDSMEVNEGNKTNTASKTLLFYIEKPFVMGIGFLFLFIPQV